jgi:hypothetical protein
MRTEIEDWKNGWFGIRLSIKAEEIDGLIAKLNELKREPDQHFHLSSTYKESGGVGDIEVSVQSDAEPSNMESGGRALLPGEDVEIGPV